MNDAAHLILTSCVTAILGVFIFCATTLLNKLVIEPLADLRRAIGDISYCLQYHAWVIHMGRETASKERYEKVFDDLRSYTARMRAAANAVYGYRFFAWLRVIPPHTDLVEASGNLVGLSNTLGMERWDENETRFKSAGELLRIDVGKPKFKRK